MGNSSGVQRRIYWIDLARAIAIISVTFNHALSRSFSTASDYYLCYADFGILLTGALLFELFRRKAELLEIVKKPVVFLSRISFGIYFVHIFIMTGLYSVLGKVSSIGRFPKFFILETVSFFLFLLYGLLQRTRRLGSICT